jgi:hypothetical protein
MRRVSARHAGRGTYFALKRYVTLQKLPAEKVPDGIREGLGKRRSWMRVSEDTFRVSFRGRSVDLDLPRHLSVTEMFRRIGIAEVEAFLGARTTNEELQSLREYAMSCLEQAFERDGIAGR